MATRSENGVVDLTPSEVHSAIRDLLELCEREHVEVPSDLESALQHLCVQTSKMEADDLHLDPKGRVPFKERLALDRSAMIGKYAEDKLIQQAFEIRRKLQMKQPDTTVRVQDGSFGVTDYIDETQEQGASKIATVGNSVPIHTIKKYLERFVKTRSTKLTKSERLVMKNVNLYLEPGKTYLVLGAPRSGKSTLLRMIAGILPDDKDHQVGGSVTLNDVTHKTSDVVWSNYVGYIDQIDRLHPFLTVQETCEFAWRCRSSGTHHSPMIGTGPEIDKEMQRLDECLYLVTTILEAMGLTRVANTFVGDQQRVRGVSGGEKKRVTVSEMSIGSYPVMCMDEISTGLDAATTYDICKILGEATRMAQNVKVVSLLQPPPETFALFDELILLSQGQIIYSGPVQDVVPHFESLGYSLPDRMDVADWLQALPTKDGQQFLENMKDEEHVHLKSEEFSEKFYQSLLGTTINTKLNSPLEGREEENEIFKKWMKEKYRNSSVESLKLLIEREMLLWWRNKTQIKARVMQDLVMGLVAGTLFWQGSDDPTSVMGILFQSMFFVSIGAMLKVAPQYDVRSILYKQQDANFFPTWAYVFGKSLASIPASIIDGVLYGSIIFWFVGLAHNEGASIGNYFMFILLVVMSSFSIGLLFSIFPSVTKDRSTGQAFMSVATLLLVLFSGYTVQPDVIPDYWVWMYWFNTFAWALRALAVNEYASGKYDYPAGVEGQTQGDVILERFGFIDGNGDPYTLEWTWWAVLYCFAICILSVLVSSFFLTTVRFPAGNSLETENKEDDEDIPAPENVEIPFQKVNLTFKDVHYTVTASVGGEQLELLKGIDGVVEAGKMTALMGSSGAGKTTLMDVLAMRKTSGDIEGEICLNGHPQEEASFRRCTGYVEQFDVQSAQLTIYETCAFSAKLRLESSTGTLTDDKIQTFVDQTLHMLELTNIQHLQVGDDASGGLSFEQRKRLSIAVELVSNPSIIFLDEPTSGLDARAAAIVMRGMKRIAMSGRAICATIHQPSIAIFQSFDALLLLKRGGETVFFGDLGVSSIHLIKYLEAYETTPKIQPGENAATWMLTTIGAGSASTDTKPFDYAGNYQVSDLHKNCQTRIDDLLETKRDDGKISFPSTFATKTMVQLQTVWRRTRTVYWRSPSYNAVRLIVSAVLALLIGSVYVSNRTPENESDMNSRATTIFMAFLFISVNSLNTVLAFFEAERNMFYRHKASLMYENSAMLIAFTVAEIPFVFVSSLVYVTIFYFMIGFAADATKFFLFWFFMALTMGNFTFLGQMFVSLTRDSVTAQGFGGLTLSMTSLFTGVLIRFENIPNFWVFMYWITPGHYIFEGLLTSQFEGDTTEIEASPGTPFWDFLGCEDQIAGGADKCSGTAEDWVFASFGGNFLPDHIPYDIGYLVGLLFVTRAITYYALGHLNFRQT